MQPSLPLKFKYNNDIRRLTIEQERTETYSLCDMKRDIRKIYSHADSFPILFKLYYIDEGI